jgi:type IV secretory pathway VirB2 component (pilin)
MMNATAPLLTACSGFLFAVLWMDLMFDAQVRADRHLAGELPESVLDSIARYYRRAVTGSRPMSHLIAVVMVVLLGALGFRAIRGHDPGWLVAVSMLLAGAPILLAATHTVPNAVRLGTRSDSPGTQTALARSIWRDHLVCAVCILAFLVLWVVHEAVL